MSHRGIDIGELREEEWAAILGLARGSRVLHRGVTDVPYSPSDWTSGRLNLTERFRDCEDREWPAMRPCQ